MLMFPSSFQSTNAISVINSFLVYLIEFLCTYKYISLAYLNLKFFSLNIPYTSLALMNQASQSILEFWCFKIYIPYVKDLPWWLSGK